MTDAPTLHGGVTPPFVRVPYWAVAAALLTVAVSLALAAVELLADEQDNIGISFAGYLLGSLVSPALVVLHRGLAQSAERDLWFLPRPRLDQLAGTALLSGLVVGTWHAFVLATEIAKRGGL